MIDRLFGFAKVVVTMVGEKSRAILANLAGPASSFDLQNPEADAGAESVLKQETFGALGLIVRSRPASSTGHTEAFCARLGDSLLPIAYRDLRLHKSYPNPKDGSAAFVGYGGGFHSLEDTEGNSGDQKATVQILYVPYSFSGGVPAKAHVITIDPSSGNESVTIVHGEGMALTMMAGGKNSVVLKNKSGSAYVEINDDGITLSGNVTVAGGMVVGASVPGAAAAALPAMTAALTPSAFLKIV